MKSKLIWNNSSSEAKLFFFFAATLNNFFMKLTNFHHLTKIFETVLSLVIPTSG